MPFQTVLGATCLLLVVALVLWRQERRTFARYSPLLTVLIPTWRFFERPESSAELLVRTCSSGGDLGPWSRVIPQLNPSVASLFWNPEGNLALASYGVVDQLVAELEDRGPLELTAAEELVSFRLVRCLVEYFCSPQEREAPEFLYQFRVVSVTPGAHGATFEELLTSDLYGRC